MAGHPFLGERCRLADARPGTSAVLALQGVDDEGVRALDGASMRTAVRTMAPRKLVDGGKDWFLPATSTSRKPLFTVPIGHPWSGAVSNGKRYGPNYGSGPLDRAGCRRCMPSRARVARPCHEAATSACTSSLIEYRTRPASSPEPLRPMSTRSGCKRELPETFTARMSSSGDAYGHTLKP